MPARAAGITADWIAAALGIPPGCVADRPPQRVGEGYGLASEIYRIELCAEHPDVVVKLWDATRPAALNEIEFYRRYAPSIAIPLPACFFAAADADTGRAVLVLEDLSPFEQGDVLSDASPSQALALAARLGALHARFWVNPAVAAEPWLRRPGRDASWRAEREEVLRARYGHLVTGLLAVVHAHLEAVADRAATALATAPHTLTHGELHLDNVVFTSRGPVILDWAHPAFQPGVVDLAQLVFFMAQPGGEARLVERYLAELHQRGVQVVAGAVTTWLEAALLLAATDGVLSMVRFEGATERERAMPATSIERARRALARWETLHPGWLDRWMGGGR